MTNSEFHYKVLPFTTKRGEEIPGHEITVHQHEWMDSPIESVVFWTFDTAIGMEYEMLVPWQRWTQMSRSEKGHSVKAVILRNGRRIHATALSPSWPFEGAYDAAPAICRGVFQIVAMGSRTPLLTIRGVDRWVYDRDPKHLVDPWKRDNAATYRARKAQGGCNANDAAELEKLEAEGY